MTGSRNKALFHGFCAVLLLAAAYAVSGFAFQSVAWLTGSELVPTWGAVALLSLTLLVVWHLCLVAGRLRRDTRLLRAAIRQIESREREIKLDGFSHDELRACAEDLSGVADRLRAERGRLTERASHDVLTGLPNRRMLFDTLSQEITVATRRGWPVALIMVDLDHFKVLNDTHGHQAGDVVLRRAADRMASLVRRSDMVARFGGEEFAIVLPRADLDEAVEIAWQLRDALRCDLTMVDHESLRVTASFGVAELSPGGSADPENLMRRADSALYQAKEDGRDTVVAAPKAASIGEEITDYICPPSERDPRSTLAEVDVKIDADTMALMGSTFSMMQVLPDKHRVAFDALQQVVTALGCERVVLYAYEEEQGRLAPMASLGIPEWEADGRPSATDELTAWFTSLWEEGGVSSSRGVEPVVMAGSSGEESSVALRLPLVVRGRPVGVIEVTGLPGDFELQERQYSILSAICLIGATALKVCELFQDVEDRWTGLIESLSRVIESGDVYKLDHAKRVSELAVRISQAMGQTDQEELRLLRTAGLVHDIGNSAIPRRVWDRKGKLRERERQLVQEHCRTGAAIIGGVPSMSRMATIVLHHHEHYDGTGYPDGLAGEEIPLECRILAVADAYDAMTSDRPYRRALPPIQAVERVLAASGSQFDPVVVNAFFECTCEDANGEDRRLSSVSKDRADQVGTADPVGSPR